MRTRSLAEAVEQHRAGRDFWVALNEFLDEFYAAGEERRSMIEQVPTLIGDRQLDGYVGAVGEHLAQRWGLDHIPQWTSAKERFLDWQWFPSGGSPKLKMVHLMYSQIAFRRRDIFTEAEPLCIPRDSLAMANHEITAELLGFNYGTLEMRAVVEDLIYFDDGHSAPMSRFSGSVLTGFRLLS